MGIIRPVTPTRAQEVYALAGALWTCITGRWPLDYAAAGIDVQNLSPVQLRSRVANRRAPLDTETPWPELQEILRPVLLSKSKDRPTAGELASLMAALWPAPATGPSTSPRNCTMLRRHLAYLTDRCLVGAGEPQIHGTQYVGGPDGTSLRLHPVAEPEGLDARRVEMGLESSAEYDRRMRAALP
ncbi:DUF6624 domain-containing protein [Streptomyces sp. NPDC002044]|uniref:DUF6624 domain-containing protein n=1 Tax=Streptomyces sp. NPDC002044 TaxID=3154662 RepID=UPI003328522E